MDVIIKSGKYKLNPKTGCVIVDLFDIQDEVYFFAKKYLQMIDESDCQECEELDAYSLDSEEMIEVLEKRGYNTQSEEFEYPLNDIRTHDAYTKLLVNIDKVPIERLEEFLEKLNIK